LVNSDSYFLLTEFLDVTARINEAGTGLSFAQKLAALHKAPPPIPEGSNKPLFGFHLTTYAGRTKQDNTFRSSWAEFYAENRLHAILRLIEESHGADQELRDWVEKTTSVVVPALLGDGHLGGRNGITPSLVHGDLWSGNKGRGRLGGKGGIEDVAFDSGCCYAHSEFDLGLMRMFGGFSAGFFSEYHRLVPKTEPVDEYEDRMTLYQM
jgi:fructosamine-3-kinase